MTELTDTETTTETTTEAEALAGADDRAPELVRAREDHTLEQQLEALLMIADEPISAVGLATTTDRPVREVRRSIQALISDYNGEGETPRRGFELREIAGGYRFYVREQLDPLIADFVQQQTPSKLSQAALETLSVIAYRQPITRGAIASIRAVNVDSVVRTLVGRGLATEVGQDAETGAYLYGSAPLLDDGSEGFDHEAL